VGELGWCRLVLRQRRNQSTLNRVVYLAVVTAQTEVLRVVQRVRPPCFAPPLRVASEVAAFGVWRVRAVTRCGARAVVLPLLRCVCPLPGGYVRDGWEGEGAAVQHVSSPLGPNDPPPPSLGRAADVMQA
jgi:hypothetical protein